MVLLVAKVVVHGYSIDYLKGTRFPDGIFIYDCPCAFVEDIYGCDSFNDGVSYYLRPYLLAW